MAVSAVSAHLALRGDLLLSGRIDGLLSTYVFPLPVFLEERLLVLHGEDHACAILDTLRQSLAARGIDRLQPKVTAVELPRAGRFRLWVDWHGAGVPADSACLSQVIYYCRETGDGTRIEMLNYTRLGHRGLHRQIETLALTA